VIEAPERDKGLVPEDWTHDVPTCESFSGDWNLCRHQCECLDGGCWNQMGLTLATCFVFCGTFLFLRGFIGAGMGPAVERVPCRVSTRGDA